MLFHPAAGAVVLAYPAARWKLLGVSGLTLKQENQDLRDPSLHQGNFPASCGVARAFSNQLRVIPRFGSLAAAIRSHSSRLRINLEPQPRIPFDCGFLACLGHMCGETSN